MVVSRKIFEIFVVGNLLSFLIPHIGRPIYNRRFVTDFCQFIAYVNNFIGIVIASAGWGGSNFLILHATFKGVPEEYREAAFMDGASHWTVLTKVMFPMTLTVFWVLFVTKVIALWTDYSTPMLF